MAATSGNVCLAEDAKAEYCECAETFTDLVSTEDPSRFYKAVTDLYRILSTYRSVELRDESIKDAIDRAFKSWGGIQDGLYVFDYKDIDYQYYSVIELIGFDGWRKVELNEGEQVNALVPGEIRHSSIKDAYPAIFEFEIYDTSTLWAEKCKVYARFCKLMARRVCTEEEQPGEKGTHTPAADPEQQRKDYLTWLENRTDAQRLALFQMVVDGKKPGDVDSENVKSKAKYRGRAIEPRTWQNRNASQLLESASDKRIIFRPDDAKHIWEFTHEDYLEAVRPKS